jgi:anti-sigma28 factor (negative regulator of flagellin synthesis)
MKAGTVDMHLRVEQVERTLQSGYSAMEKFPVEVEKSEKGEKGGKGETAWVGEQELIKRSMRATQRWPQERDARVEELRSLVQSGRYRIDCKVIAECLLNNETHFV